MFSRISAHLKKMFHFHDFTKISKYKKKLYILRKKLANLRISTSIQKTIINKNETSNQKIKRNLNNAKFLLFNQ